MLVYIYLFFFVALISAGSIPKKVKLFLLFFILSFFAGTRLDIDSDYGLYKYNIRYVESTIKDFANRSSPMEWCMYIIPNSIKLVIQSKIEIINYSFLTFAFLGVGIKLIAINRLTPFFFLSIILYTSNLYFMQEMTTIRAGVATGIFLWSIKDIEENRNKVFFVKLGFAFLFHYSSIVFVIAWLLHKFNVKYKWLILGLCLAMLVPILNLNFIEILHLNVISDKADAYTKIQEYEDKKLNLFNFKIVISLFYLIIFYWQRNKIAVQGFDLLLKIHFLSLILFFLFSTTGLTFSLRTFELLSIIQVILYPLIILCFISKLKILGYLLVMGTSFIFFYYNIFIADFLKEYTSWLF